MVKDLVIIGAGDLGREVSVITERINAQNNTWNILGFVDDNPDIIEKKIDGYNVVGNISWLENYPNEIHVVCSLGDSKTRRKIIEKVSVNPNIKFATIIDPDAILMKDVNIGEGSIICAGAIITINVNIGNHSIINLNCTVGHDTVLGDYFTAHPGSNISGRVVFGQECYCGTGTRIIQGVKITDNCTFGAGAVLVSNAESPGLYVGVPARLIHD